MSKDNKGIINSINLNAIENLSLSELEKRTEFSAIPFTMICDYIACLKNICDGILCDVVCDCVASVCDCITEVCDQICDNVCDNVCDYVCDNIF